MKAIGIQLILAAQALALAPHFEENRGQAEMSGGGVQFLTRDRGRQVFFTSQEVVWSTDGGQPVRLRFPGASGAAKWSAAGARTGDISYFVGNDSSKWVRNAGQFERIVWRGVYPGIDAVFYWRGGRLEYDLMAAAGADLNQVRVQWIGPDVRLDAAGAITIAGGEIRQLAPVIDQGAVRISGHFEAVGGGEFRLALGEYDRQRPIVVDPVIESSVFIGGENDDHVTVTRDGFVAGTTASVRLPGTAADRRRSRDVFVQGTGRAGPLGNIQFAGTVVLGGGGDDDVASGFFDGSRQVIIAGTTSSDNFVGTTQPVKGGSDGFVCTLSSDGRFFPAPQCYLVGGSGDDRIHSVSGPSSFTYIYAGETTSSDLLGAVGSYKGGVDGFFGGPFLPNRYYLGGSGDDRVLAASIVGSNPTRVFLAGETRSEQFDYAADRLRGPSDGFLTVFTFATLVAPVPAPSITSHLVGGSGEDRITAVSATVGGPRTVFLNELDPFVAIAGTTSSADLPMREAAQPNFAGETDAFLGMWRNDGFEWLTYLGGSGADEASAVERNWAGDLFVTGSTRSTDLKTVLPIQDRAGGGEDAFYAVAGPGVFRTLTYYGGSGDDKATSLALVREGTARIGGWSNSSDLPLAIDSSSERGRGADGFYVELGSSYLFSVPRLHLAKDGAVSAPIRAAQAAPATLVTYRSSDRAKVLITDGTTPKEELTVPLETFVNFEGMADSGEAEVTVSAAGFEPAVIRVKLYPGMANLNAPAFPVSVVSSAVGAWVSWVPRDPATGAPLPVRAPDLGSTIPRAGFRVPPIKWTSSNQQVVRIDASSDTIGGFVRWSSPGVGESLLRAEIEGLPVFPPDGVSIRVIPPSIRVAPSMNLGKDLQAQIIVTLVPNLSNLERPPVLTVRSGDPSKLLLSADTATAGSESLSFGARTIPFRGVSVQALASEGEVPVIFSLPDYGSEAVTMVRLEPARMRWGFRSVFNGPIESALRTVKGGTHQPVFVFEGVSGAPSDGLRPGIAPPEFRFASSDARVLELSRITVRPSIDTLTVTALTEGSATLSLVAEGLPPVELVNSPASVAVGAVPPRLDANPPAQLIVGKDLQVPVTFRYSQSGSAISVVAEDGSAVAVSASQSQPGGASASLPLRPGGDYTFYVQGLRESGETGVVVRYPGGEARTRITLLPSGLGLPEFNLASTVDRRLNVALYALDDVTEIPLQPQLLGPGKRVSVSLRSEGAAVRLSNATLELDSTSVNREFTVSSPQPGEVATVIAEASSYKSASSVLRGMRNRFQSIRSATVMEDAILSQRVDFNPGRILPVRITSSNPEAVLVSLSASQPGVAALDVDNRSSGFEIFLHGVKAVGRSTVTIQAESFEPLEIAVTVFPLRAALGFESNAVSTPVGGSMTGALNLAGGLGTLSPRAAPIRYTLRSSDPSIATVTPAEVVLLADRSVNFTVTGRSPGYVELLAESDRVPSSAFARLIAVRAVAVESVPIQDLILPSNMQQVVNIAPYAGNSAGVIATATSSDPTRVVVARNDSAVGGASTTVAIQAGSGGTFFVQSMGVPGQAEIAVRVPGFPDQRWLVRIVPSWFAAYTERTEMSIGATGFASAGVAWAGDSFSSMRPSLRPDLRPMTVRLTNSDPNIAVLSGDTITTADGVGSPSVTVRALAEGATRIGVEQPPGFGPSPAASPVLRVVRPKIILNCSDGIVLARDTQQTCFLNLPSGTVLEALSSDPEKLVVSANATAVGSGRQTINGTSSTPLTFQALAASGTVEVLLSAPGFESIRVPIVLRPTEIRAEPLTLQIRRGEIGQLRLTLYTAPVGNQGARMVTARAGSNIQVGLAAVPAGIVSFDPASAKFDPGTQGAIVRVRGETTGAAVLRMTVPDGFSDGTTQPNTFVVQ